jgi:hypothetical protein
MENNSRFLMYQSEDGQTRVEVRLEGDSLWLTQQTMATLFQTTKQNISLHLKNIFQSRELSEEAVVKEYLTTASDKKEYRTKYYNLEAIISVGYRVRSHRGTQFRRWATERLNEYLVKGLTMDEERLKSGRNIGSDYFDELLERIRDIRASEKRFYQKIRDIYKLAADYDPQSQETKEFFSIVQNKLHFAIAGKTAAETIVERADASKPNMGLTSWHGSKVRRKDVTIAKNYLNVAEVKELNRIVTMYLDYAEDQAKRHRQIFMQDWRKKLDGFLSFNEREILDNPGGVAKAVADQLAIKEYDAFNARRLAVEAESEAAADDEALKQISQSLEDRAGK